MTHPAFPMMSLADVGRTVTPRAHADAAPVLTFKGLRPNGSLDLAAAASGRFAEALPGDVIFTKQGHIAGWVMRKVGLVERPAQRIHVASTLQVFRSSDRILPEWLYLWLSSPQTFKRVQEIVGGRNSLTAAGLARVEIPCPSLDEQRHIVDLLESHLGRVEAGLRAVEAARMRLRRLRQSWLTEAIAGLQVQRTTVGAELLESRGGWSRSRSHTTPADAGVPYLKMNNIAPTGGLSLDSFIHVAGSPGEFEKYAIREGDVLFNSKNSGELVGKTAVADGRVVGWTFNENIMRLRFSQRVLPAFAGLWFHAPEFRKHVRTATSASTNVAAVYMQSLRTFPLAVPPIEDQQRLVRADEAMQASELELSQVCEDTSRKSQALKAALLQAAFSGRLAAPVRDVADRV